MPAGEFQLIERHLTGLGAARADVDLAVGDDAAVLAPAAGELRVAVSGTGAAGGENPERAAEECVRRAVGALRAAGATPAWATVALTLDDGDDAWVARFATALHAACVRENVSVVGGDTTTGMRAVTVFVTGFYAADATA